MFQNHKEDLHEACTRMHCRIITYVKVLQKVTGSDLLNEHMADKNSDIMAVFVNVNSKRWLSSFSTVLS